MMFEALRPTVMVVLATLLLLGCSDGDADVIPGAGLTASCTAPLTGTGPRVFLDCGTVSGNLVTVDVIGADITDQVDAYNLIIFFSPSAFTYLGFDRKSTLFTTSDCDLVGDVLCLDNSGTANSDSRVVLGVSKIGVTPIGVTIGTGSQQTLARLIFRAASASQTLPAFSTSAQAGCVGQDTTGTALLEVISSVNCASTVISGITFSNQVTLAATP